MANQRKINGQGRTRVRLSATRRLRLPADVLVQKRQLRQSIGSAITQARHFIVRASDAYACLTAEILDGEAGNGR